MELTSGLVRRFRNEYLNAIKASKQVWMDQKSEAECAAACRDIATMKMRKFGLTDLDIKEVMFGMKGW